jgi:cytoskeletal protein CcmA (bactofilin family)
MIQHTNIGRTLTINGDITASEELVIEGKIKANQVVVSGFPLVIGKGSVIEAALHAAHVTIFGKVTGSVSADESIHLGPTAEVRGDIKAPKVHIDDLAILEGRIYKA